MMCSTGAVLLLLDGVFIFKKFSVKRVCGTVFPISICYNGLKGDFAMDKKKAIAKKTIIIYILNVLKRYSSEEYPVSQTAVCNYLNDIDVPCERKTVGRNIRYLIEYGYPIKKVYGKGYYLDKNKMEELKNSFIL